MHIANLVDNVSSEFINSAIRGYYGKMDQLFSGLFEFEQIQTDFPHHVIVEIDDFDFQLVNKWCFAEFGHQHGECEDLECDFDWVSWYYKSDIKQEFDNKVEEIKNDKTIDKETIESRIKELRDSHFDYVNTHYIDDTEPGYEHSHKGVWKTVSIIPTGYDLEYIAYCFKKKEDAMFFALTWK